MKKVYLVTMMAVFLAFSSMAPSYAFAKSNNGNNGKGNGKSNIEAQIKVKNKNENRSERKSDREDQDDDKNKKSERSEETKKIPPGICKLMKKGFIPPGWAKNWFNVDEARNRNCLPESGVSTTTPPTDTIAPVISNIGNYTGNSFAVITWDTNEKTTGKVFWSTSTVSTSSAPSVVSWSTGNHHFAVINGLTAGTSYKGVIEAKDKAGNKSYSSEFSFVTTGTAPVTPDTTAPTLSAIVATSGTSTINVSWQTNENADSKVFYGTSTPLNTGTALSVSNSSLVANHALQLSGLATGTTYYMVLTSKDASGNTATSTQFATTTLAN